MRLSLPPISASPSSDDVNNAISLIRAELEVTSDPTKKALLHYEVALLFEQTRDDNAAAKELLLAVNTLSSLHEPLEHLIGLIERRRSYANLGKLLDRLGRIAESPAEIARAQLARGDFLADHRTNLAQAAEAYEQVTKQQPDHRLAWLSLHYLGARQSDAKLVEHALAARIAQASHRGYRDGLRLQLARFQALRGRHDLARATLEAAASPHSPMLYPALLQLERLVRSEDYASRAKVLEQQAEVLALGLADKGYASSHGIPVSHAQRTTVADVSLRAALNIALSHGTSARIVQALDRALDAGTDPLLVQRIAQYAEQGNAVAGSFSGLPAGEELSAAMFCERAFDLSTAPDDTVVQWVNKALSHDQKSVTARAIQLDASWARGSFAELALAYEDIARLAPTEAARTRHSLLAAACWTFSDEPSERARAMLTRAAPQGRLTSDLARFDATLASIRGDQTWRGDALQALLDGTTSPEQTTALLELTLRALQRRDFVEARQRLQTLSTNAEAAPLTALMLAFVPELTEDTPHGNELRIAAIERVAEWANTDVAAPLTQWAAHLRLSTEDADAARARLLTLHEKAPDQVGPALQLAANLVAADDAELAVRVLTQTANASEDDRTSTVLHYYAGILAWKASARETAVRCFEAGVARSTSTGDAHLLQWALRAAAPDDAKARRKLLSTASSKASEEDRVHALERFALEVGFGNQKAAATEALDSADEVSLDEVGEAVQLARALWTEAAHHQEALRHLEHQGQLGKELAACVAFYAAKSQPSPSAEELTARVTQWAKLGSPAANLEWLGVASTTGHPTDEAAALRAIASHLPPAERPSITAAASLIEFSSGQRPQLATDRLTSDTSLAELLVAAEVYGPTSDPNNRARVLDDLASRSEDEHAEQTVVTRLLAAYNYLADENFDAAARLFRLLAEEDPTDLSVWEGLVECARHQGDRETLAEALMHVGQQHSQALDAAAALREAAECFLDELGDEALGWSCLDQAVELDVSDPRAFDRLFRHVRKQAEHARVIDLCTRRLTVADSAKEIVKLHWERARAQRSLGLVNEALADLGNVRMLEPDHIGSRALASEIYISLEDFGNAATELSEIAALRNAPPEQRHLSALTAIDLYDNRLNDLPGALGVFEAVREVPGDLQPLIEHLVSACARRERWEDAVNLLEGLQVHGKSATDRAEAARLELAILRDELEQPERATRAVTTLLVERPGDPEAVDLILDGVFTEHKTSELLRDHLEGILSLAANEFDAEAAARLARIAEELDHLDLRLLSLAGLVVTGNSEGELMTELGQLLERCPPYPQMVIPPETRALLTSDFDTGPLLEILRLVAPHLPELLGPSLRTLGLGRKERKAAADATLVRDEISAWRGALSIGEVEVYLANRGGYEVLGIPDEKVPSLVIASDAHALDVRDRGSIAAWLFGLARGTSVALQRPTADVAALLVAACRVGGVSPESPPFALVPEFERLLSRELPRKTRRALEPLAKEVVATRQDPLTFAAGARETLDRVAAVACGDFSHVILTKAERASGIRNFDSHRREQLAALLRFCLSPTYLRIRDQLGLSAR
jgi:hypothetical protein